MGIPIIYRKSSEGAIASYSFIDIAEGTGIINFYGADTEDNSVKDHSLMTNQIYSNDIYTTATVGFVTPPASVKALDIDFDVTFTVPKILKGIIRLQVPWAQGSASSANFNGTSFILARARKWDGTAETELRASIMSKNLTVGSLVIGGAIAMIEIIIPNRIHFKKGETLRITIEVWASVSGSQGTIVYLMHDPMNRAFITFSNDFPTTVLLMQVPFVIDL